MRHEGGAPSASKRCGCRCAQMLQRRTDADESTPRCFDATQPFASSHHPPSGPWLPHPRRQRSSKMASCLLLTTLVLLLLVCRASAAPPEAPYSLKREPLMAEPMLPSVPPEDHLVDDLTQQEGTDTMTVPPALDDSPERHVGDGVESLAIDTGVGTNSNRHSWTGMTVADPTSDDPFPAEQHADDDVAANHRAEEGQHQEAAPELPAGGVSGSYALDDSQMEETLTALEVIEEEAKRVRDEVENLAPRRRAWIATGVVVGLAFLLIIGGGCVFTVFYLQRLKRSSHWFHATQLSGNGGGGILSSGSGNLALEDARDRGESLRAVVQNDGQIDPFNCHTYTTRRGWPPNPV
ncbi:unnamed protein product [Vitrella brassicaformis CCMP3155]|uniref:Uncharacterized protein n=1 Tax=Vitrella brassicaformis (strain CCMP3155) TaxID=1169540 RepID=A0A0G4FQ31_VITBC|nr:unnamed protein product [Vitrella brassicaformis CCMP3155]|mmetsp:Transcript_5034/g.11747  ORF Transcript_5034/g.11747 Transcript_5034/m.11747 type:complete len:351 (-) Transcript_5034:627-1679(-)|eukprot:CEM16395.1 unnamed protein product [Vitrella brassicaformis CCMP3155]